MTKKFILIGAKLPTKNVPNPGGQLTASIGLVDFVESLGFEIEVIDTTQSSFPVPPLKERLLKGVSRTKRLYAFLKNEHINGVIIFSSSGFSFYERIVQSLICRLHRVPDILFVRSGHFMNAVNNSILHRFVAKTLLKVPVRLGAQGSAWISFYESLGIKKDKSILIRNWLQRDFPEVNKFRSYNTDNTLKFIFVGWLVKEKGIPQLLDAVAKLSSEYKFEMHFVGGGTLEEYCSEYKNCQNLDGVLYLHGWQDKLRVIDLLNESDVFILPSEAEGFPNSLLEAVALGLPAISTNVGGVSDTLHDNENGYLLESNESELIYKAMKDYLNSPEIIASQSKVALEIYKTNHNRKRNCEILLNQFNIE